MCLHVVHKGKFTILQNNRIVNRVTHCGFSSWPWQWFALGTDDRPMFVTSDGYIPLKSKLDWSEVVLCASEIIQQISVVFCVVRDVHKCDFRFVTNETPNKYRPVERGRCSDRYSYFWQVRRSECKGLCTSCAGQPHSLGCGTTAPAQKRWKGEKTGVLVVTRTTTVYPADNDTAQ